MIGVATLPALTVACDGAPLPDALLPALTDVRVQQRLSLPTQCELTFAAPLDTPPAALAPGRTLRLSTEGADVPLFDGEITALEYSYGATAGAAIRVRGYDLLHRLRKRQTVRAYVQVTARDLAQQLTADFGLGVHADEPGPVWQHLIQHRPSDFALLVETAQACGLFLTMREDGLHLLTLDGDGDPVPLVLGETLLEARIEVNGDPACRSVTATGWDPLRVETHAGTASQARVGRRVPAAVGPAQVGGSGERALVDQATQDDHHAEGVAQAELDLDVAREVTFWGVAEGDPRLRPGVPVELSGVADEVAGTYVLTAVTHTIDLRSGYVSELQTAPPPPVRAPRAAVATPGHVTRVDDPDRLGRVRVALPTYGGVETEWMTVMAPGAGADKGFVALPDIGDQVLVLFAHEDPGEGVVLGGLYGTTPPFDSGVDGGTVRRFAWQTPGGQRVTLDDAQQRLRLEDQSGSYVELAPDHVLLHAAANLVLEAPGKSVTIRGQAVDFERG